MSSISITSAFDSGNIRSGAAVTLEGSPPVVQLRIRPDPFTLLEQKKHMQWFSFRAMPPAGTSTVRYDITNANEASFPSAWPGTAVCYSLDRKVWKRCWSTVYKDGVLSWEFDHSQAPGGGERCSSSSQLLRLFPRPTLLVADAADLVLVARALCLSLLLLLRHLHSRETYGARRALRGHAGGDGGLAWSHT
jgi:hypothetical protein